MICLFVQLRLTPEQNDEKREAESAVKEVEDELQAETDEAKHDALKTEVAERKDKLATLIDGFQVSTLLAFISHFIKYVCLSGSSE